MSNHLKPPSRIGSLANLVRARHTDSGLIAGAIQGRRGARAILFEAITTSRVTIGILMVVAFFLTSTALVILTREQPLIAVGKIMDETRIVRVPLALEDRSRTQQARDSARLSTPQVYRADLPVLEEIEQSIESLPQVVAAATNLDQIPASLRDQFGLDGASMEALMAEAIDGKPTSAWVAKSRNLLSLLRARPLVDRSTYQLRSQEGTSPTVKLIVGEEALPPVHRSEVVNVEDASVLSTAMHVLARDAGFTGPARQAVVNRLTVKPKPTFTYDAAATARDQVQAARGVDAIVTQSAPGQVIYQRGERLTLDRYDLYRAELRAFNSGEGGNQPLVRRTGVLLACLGITFALAGYAALFCRPITETATRIVSVSAMLTLGLVAASVGTIWAPSLAAVTVTAPAVLVAILTCIAYDRRSALAFGLLSGLLACLATRATLGSMIVTITGVACVVWTLREIRDRTSLVRTSLITALGAGLATVVVGLLDRPLVDGVLPEITIDAVVTGLGVLSLGAMTLLFLPIIERAFGVTTGMTLLDLRDPKQALLRELQLRAPGTYNHSLSVASIAEAAAEAVGADALLTYVGALYHDIGKMSKPEYFIENQFGGPNKHDRLTPAMSLLVVVGHVKDGMELARDFNLPKNVQHFIESHHGTTLVEYFYHRAKLRAIEAQRDNPRDEGVDPRTLAPDDPAFLPNEFDYRYPGPKPQTKEAAILMICDAVESATRSLSDPTPSRIEALVRSLANKRLLDGQFDDCELTLRDLSRIVDSVSRTIASMYHGRIAYPAADPGRVDRAVDGGRVEEPIEQPQPIEGVRPAPEIAMAVTPNSPHVASMAHHPSPIPSRSGAAPDANNEPSTQPSIPGKAITEPKGRFPRTGA